MSGEQKRAIQDNANISDAEGFQYNGGQLYV